jgi:shikimate 5-dehydrogenase
MKRFGLIGHPVAGSFSPKLFEAAYGGRYAYDLLEGAEFSASWQRFLDEYDGINITAPFKEFAFRAVDALSDDARLCGAVNLAVKTPAGIVGYNTDVAGVVLAVREALAGLAFPDTQPVIPGSPDTQPVIPGSTGNLLKEALVVGCGGAGRAAAVAALRLGCRVTLANRTPSRAAALAEELGCAWIPAENLAALSPDLVIYTVPGPMDGFPEFPEAIILEANYRTPCLEGRGKAYISGLRWLLYQAVAGYEIFTGETPDADAMFRIFC